MAARKSPEIREEEILGACEKLYEKKCIKNMTIKDISEETSCSRPSIYNYFNSVEEVFFRLFEREYLFWCADLEKIEAGTTDACGLPEKLAASLAERKLMLRLIADNIYGVLYAMGENSRQERQISFEKAYGKSLSLFDSILKKAFPDRSDPERKKMRDLAFEFLHGIHIYASVTPYQVEVMKIAGVNFEEKSIYERALEGYEIILR